MQHILWHQLGHWIIAEKRGEERGRRRQVRDLGGRRRRHARRGKPAEERHRQGRGEADSDDAEEDADAYQRTRVLKGCAHAGGDAALFRRNTTHDRGRVGRGEHTLTQAKQKEQEREPDILEVDRQEGQQHKAHHLDEHACRRKDARPEAVREPATQRDHQDKADEQGQQVDAGPQGGDIKIVAMERQPDALQPDDEHELQAAARDAGQEAAGIAGREGTDFKEVQAKHGVRDALFDKNEGHQQDDTQDDAPDDEWAAPAGRSPAIGLDAVGDAEQKDRRAKGEGDVAGPVNRLMTTNDGGLAQHQVGPDRPDDAHRHAHQEDVAPVKVG